MRNATRANCWRPREQRQASRIPLNEWIDERLAETSGRIVAASPNEVV
jgi:hypothetical protein